MLSSLNSLYNRFKFLWQTKTISIYVHCLIAVRVCTTIYVGFCCFNCFVKKHTLRNKGNFSCEHFVLHQIHLGTKTSFQEFIRVRNTMQTSHIAMISRALDLKTNQNFLRMFNFWIP